MITLLVFHVYFKNKNKFVLSFGLFFFFFSTHLSFRLMGLLTESSAWYFLHVFSLMLGTVSIFYGLSQYGVKWIKRYSIIPISIMLAFLISYLDAFVLGYHLAEANMFARIVTLGFGGLGLMIVGEYFYMRGKKIWKYGRNIMSVGFTLEGLLHFAAILLVPLGILAPLFVLGLAFTITIGIGLYISLYKQKKSLKKL